jgi:two-component system, cell cycle response regulator
MRGSLRMVWIGHGGASLDAVQLRELRELGWLLEQAKDTVPDDLPVIHLVLSEETETAALARLPLQHDVQRLPAATPVLAARMDRLHRRRRAEGTDLLTGLLVRRAFEGEAATALASPPGAGVVALVMLDVDHFKRINDEHAHSAGDTVLTGLADVIRSWADGGDIVARYGGEEFALLLRRADRADLEADLDRLRVLVGAAPCCRDLALRITVSMGVALQNGRGVDDLESLLRRADAALYSAKAAGRDRIEFADSGPSESRAHESELRRFMDVAQVHGERMSQMMKIMGRRLVERTRQDALHDELTGMFNRRYFNERVVRDWAQARKHGMPMSIAFLDLDDFGNVNRQYGYPNGDAVLRRFAQLAADQVRLSDWLVRWGGEEFCVVLPGTSLAEASEVAHRLHQAIGQAAFELQDGRSITVTCSVGVAVLDETMTSPEALTARASDAARRAKAAGKNRVEVDEAPTLPRSSGLD